MLEYILYLIYIILLLTNFIYIKSYYHYCHYLLLLSSSNDASADIADDEGSFQFCHQAEFASTLH